MLAEAARGLKEAISVVKCALHGRKELSAPSSIETQPLTTNTATFTPCSIDVFLGGGCIELALARKLRQAFVHSDGQSQNSTVNHAVQVIVKGLEGIYYYYYYYFHYFCKHLIQDLWSSWQLIVG